MRTKLVIQRLHLVSQLRNDAPNLQANHISRAGADHSHPSRRRVDDVTNTTRSMEDCCLATPAHSPQTARSMAKGRNYSALVRWPSLQGAQHRFSGQRCTCASLTGRLTQCKLLHVQFFEERCRKRISKTSFCRVVRDAALAGRPSQ